ncbi:hypothetical protein ACOMHN_064321 [Nucella lapillus]
MTSSQSTKLHTGFSDLLINVHSYNNNNNTNSSHTPFSSVFIPCDNPRNVVSPFVAEIVDLVVYAGIFPVLVTCGVITNVINMAVFARQGLSDRIRLCLFSLAVSDIGFLLFLMCGKSYALISQVDPVAGNLWLQQHNGPVLGNYLAFLSISNTVTAIIAVERCRCVVSPFKAVTFLRTKYMGVLITVVSVAILVVENVSLTLKYQTVQISDPLTNNTAFISRLTPFYLRHRTIIDIFDIYLVSVTVPLLSLIVVIVCTTAIILRLKVSASWRRKSASNMTSMEKKETVMTRMLVTMCCVYVATMTPSVGRALVLFVRLPGFLITGFLCNIFKASTACTLLLEAVNASVNFLIYVKQSSQYRATLHQMFLCVGRHGGGEGRIARSVECRTGDLWDTGSSRNSPALSQGKSPGIQG